MGIIEFQNVSKYYQKDFWKPKSYAINDLSFEVKENSATGFIGPNGAGKTTSLKILLGLLIPDRGKTLIKGKDTSIPKNRQSIGFVSEQPYFYSHLTVRESLEFIYNMNNLPSKNRSKEIDRVLAEVQLENVGNKRVNEMSKGMQQRLNMSQALMGKPDLYILDEPMSGLDPLGRRLFRTIIEGLRQEGKTIFFSTHILDDIENLCTDIIVLSEGRQTYAGSVGELIEESVSGVDIILHESFSEESLSSLERYGVVSSLSSGRIKISIQSSEEAQHCQKYLAQQEIFPLEVHKKNHSLESILYKGGKDTV